MEPYSFKYLYESFRQVTTDLVLYLPRTSDLRQIARDVDGSKDSQTKTDVAHYCTNGSSRALCVYIGNWARLSLSDV